MTEAEALKILNIELKDLNDNEKINLIMNKYVKMFNKNNVIAGGSAYI